MMTSKMAKEAAASAANSAATTAAPLKSTTVASTKAPVSDEEEKVKRMFYPPYTGYDQPTRDEGQLAMPQLLTRRSYSDTNFIAAAAAAASVKSDGVEEGGDAEEQEDFCSLSSSSTDNSTQLQGGILNSPQLEIEARFRQFLVDMDEMEIHHRGTIRAFYPASCDVVLWICPSFTFSALGSLDELSAPRASNPRPFDVPFLCLFCAYLISLYFHLLIVHSVLTCKGSSLVNFYF